MTRGRRLRAAAAALGVNVARQDGLVGGGTSVSGSRPPNTVVLALVVALLDLEQRRTRGKVRPPMRTRPAA
jgi:hypothetical protein